MESIQCLENSQKDLKRWKSSMKRYVMNHTELIKMSGLVFMHTVLEIVLWFYIVIVQFFYFIAANSLKKKNFIFPFRISHTIVLDDPFDDPKGLVIQEKSPEPTQEQLDVRSSFFFVILVACDRHN